MIIGHQKQWEFLKSKFGANQLSHAYLFTGTDGIGKKYFAKEFSEFIGCKFPDLMIIESDEKKEIPVAKIREVQNFLAYKSYNGGFKIVVVDDAHLMNQEAQSCFLKTLEEPKGQTILFLISSKPDMLLSTIYSRCQTMKFFRPKDLPENPVKSLREQKILEKLVPILNSSFAEKFRYVKEIDFPARNASHSDAGGEKQNAAEIVQVLQKYLRQQLLSKIGTSDVAKLKKSLELTEEINNKLLFTNANPKLALEILLLEL